MASIDGDWTLVGAVLLLWLQGLAFAVMFRRGQAYVRATSALLQWPVRALVRLTRRAAGRIWHGLWRGMAAVIVCACERCAEWLRRW